MKHLVWPYLLPLYCGRTEAGGLPELAHSQVSSKFGMCGAGGGGAVLNKAENDRAKHQNTGGSPLASICESINRYTWTT